MPAVQVPDLQRKLALIRSYGRKNWEDVGTAFGVPHKTVQHWARESALHTAGNMPDRHVAKLTELIAGLLPPDTAAEAVRTFVYGPVALLEEEIRTGVSASLSKIIAAEGKHDRARLFRRGDLGLVEYEGQPDEAALPRLKLGEWFRIAFPLVHPCRYAIALQNAHQSWVVLSSNAPDGGPVRVPAYEDDDHPCFMVERRDLGRHLFVCLQSAAPFPATLDAFRREHTILDKRALDTLAGAYEVLDPKRRACSSLSLVVEEAEARAGHD